MSLLEFGFSLVARLKSKLKFKKGGRRIHWWWSGCDGLSILICGFGVTLLLNTKRILLEEPCLLLFVFDDEYEEDEEAQAASF